MIINVTKLLITGDNALKAALCRGFFKKMYVGLKVKVGGLQTDCYTIFQMRMQRYS